MRVPLSWLREHVPVALPVEELARLLTVAGLEVEKVEGTGEAWEHVLVGEVLRVVKHPDADRLQLATVSTGDEQLTVVTGAPNVRAGQRVAFARVGAQLWDAYSESPRRRKLKPSKIRGVPSQGMVCSARELGLGEEHDGILELPPDAPLGEPLSDVLGDVVLELDLVPSFAHAENVVGLARELAAITGAPFAGRDDAHARPGSGHTGPGRTEGEATPAAVEGDGLVERYMLQRFDGIRVGPSSERVQRRLLASGMRPINNVVDVTNYVMLELGQPMHAFDRAAVEGRVIVREARPGEELVTLDGQRRTMPAGTIMIADERKAVGIGGVMGGANSEVGPETTSIYLESARFDPVRIRRAARAMGLPSEASRRFERFLDPERAAVALLRATELLREEAGAEPVGAPFDYYPAPAAPAPVRLPEREIPRLLGIAIEPAEVERILRSLGFTVSREPEAFVATPPSYRRDVTLAADLVEEVGRSYGYDRVPPTLPASALPPQRTDPAALLERRAREWLAGAGLQETINYALTSPAALEPLRGLAPGGGPVMWRPAEELVRVRNPLSVEHEYLRPALLPGLLRNARENLRHTDRVWLFELDRAFESRDAALPDEPKRLAVLVAGARHRSEPYWEEPPAGVQDLKGVIAGLLGALGVRSYALEPADALGPGARNALGVEVGGACAGYIWELGASALEAADLPPGVAVAELAWEPIVRAAGRVPTFRPFSRFPEVLQDLAVIVDEAVPAGAVESVIRRSGGRYLRDVRLAEIYRGAPLSEGKKSLLHRLVFQADDRSLTEEDASAGRRTAVAALREQLGASPRGADR